MSRRPEPDCLAGQNQTVSQIRLSRRSDCFAGQVLSQAKSSRRPSPLAGQALSQAKFSQVKSSRNKLCHGLLLFLLSRSSRRDMPCCALVASRCDCWTSPSAMSETQGLAMPRQVQNRDITSRRVPRRHTGGTHTFQPPKAQFPHDVMSAGVPPSRLLMIHSHEFKLPTSANFITRTHATSNFPFPPSLSTHTSHLPVCFCARMNFAHSTNNSRSDHGHHPGSHVPPAPELGLRPVWATAHLPPTMAPLHCRLLLWQ